MKPAPSLLERENTMPVKERIEFTIGDPRALMRINAKQYSDSTTAVIREYSTNAYDSHVMAGHADPIEVSLPSLLDPFFEVRDHGVGMNVDTFRLIYTRFGTSDKTESVLTNGQMGIGSKSGVAYTTQFVVTSVKDGIRTEAKVVREPDWTLALDVYDEYPTDEPNGTVIRVPVHNVDEFRHKAQEFFKFWLPGRVLIDGKPSVHHVGQKIAKNLYYSANWNTSYVVLANVAYRINNPAALFRESKLASLNFVAYVDDLADEFGNAPIEFTPSREDLEYSDLTKKTLQDIINKFESDLKKTAQDEINKAKSHAEAYTAWAKWKSTLNANLFGDLEYKGDKFISNYPVMGKKYVLNSSSAGTMIKEWGVEMTPRTVFIEDFNINTTAEVRRKVKAYCDKTWPGATISYYVFTSATSYDCVWVEWDKQMRVRWEDLKKALPKNVVTRTYSPSDRIKGSWDYWDIDGYHEQMSCPTGKTLVYVSVYDNRRYEIRRILSLIAAKDVAVLIVPMNRLDKLKRENPTLEHFRTWAFGHYEHDGAKLLSAEAKKIFAIDDARTRWVNALDTSRIKDPELKRLGKLLSRKAELLAEYKRHEVLASLLRTMYTEKSWKPYSASTIEAGSLFDKYPLIRAVNSSNPISDDVYLYMNAKYDSERKKKK